MHGREGEERKRRQHMWPVPAPGTALSASSAAHPPPPPPPPPPTLAQPENASSESDSPLSSRDSFLKNPEIPGHASASFSVVNVEVGYEYRTLMNDRRK
ncbi:hypothetical protein MUK42_33926 [Musa troglodytarum]|uniref:Uncharacterized protein n=1 Tax=Musa troglodytarum TaxID=320322 RepID=A0A9E7KBD0_9LILI|nr:hypothetical protein MUK42_33926 [Musa troglodytarum]